MYGSIDDPYCYAGSRVLKNRAGLRDQANLDAFEHEVALQRAEEPAPAGRLGSSHYKALHRHLFQDVYAWAGKIRTVRISKNDSHFCYPEHINDQLEALFAELQAKKHLIDLSSTDFAKEAAHFLAELNAIHPFREGNGRTQLFFLALLAENAGHPFDTAWLDPNAFLNAMIISFGGAEQLLAKLIEQMLVESPRDE